MEFVKVESSQIDSVGFGDGSYGPETLGVRFKSKSGITEYHYHGVSSRMHQAMMGAESIGKYFGANIKGNPAHSFVKVDHIIERVFAEGARKLNAPDPMSASTPARIVDAEKPVSLQSNGAEPTTDTDPGNKLALIDTMEDDKLFAPGGVTDAQLEAGRQWYLAEAKKRDISTEKSRAEFKRFARPLQKLRTGIEARAKELTGATKRKIAAIDTEKRRLVQIVGGIEDEVLGPLTAWEQEEEQRKIGLANQVKAIEGRAEVQAYVDIPSLEAAIDEVESFDVTTMQEYRLSAESAKEVVLRRLKLELERRKVAEAERLELEQLREERAAAAERERLAEQQRQEQERIDAAAEKLAQAKIQQAVETAKMETRQEVIAELAAPFEDVQPSVYPEAPTPVDDMPVTTVRALPITGMVETREQVFNREAVAGLMGHVNLDRQTAIHVLTAIKAGNVPHIQIVY